MGRKRLNPEEVKSKITQIFELYDELKELNTQAKSELSLIDKELSSQYHKIEGSDIEYMSDSHFMIIKLKDILWQRRDAKINYTLLESIVSSLSSGMGKSKKRNDAIIKRHEELLKEITKRAK